MAKEHIGNFWGVKEKEKKSARVLMGKEGEHGPKPPPGFSERQVTLGVRIGKKSPGTGAGGGERFGGKGWRKEKGPGGQEGVRGVH